MKITAYRICRSEHVATIWTGVGARDYGGRWNSKGVAVVYASQSRALAAMEQLVHLIQPRVLDGFVVASIAFEEGQVQVIDRVSLPAGWRHPVAPAALRVLGDDWATTARYAVLAVPSAVVEGEWDYLINSAHVDFSAMHKSAPETFVYDDRLK